MAEGLLGEFDRAEALVEAVKDLRARGYRDLDTFTPYPLAAAEEAMDLPRSPIPRYALVGALTGVLVAVLVQWYCNAANYPLRVGGRPMASLPAYVPIAFEMGILGASLTAFLSFFALARLPRLWHPAFEIDAFGRASIDRFFLLVRGEDPRFDPEETPLDLGRAGAVRVVPVEGEEA